MKTKICSIAQLLLLGFAATVTLAQSPPVEKALAIAASDSRIAWGPCPPFMPAGCALGVLRGDPSKPNADVLFRVLSGQTVPRHWHSSAERMILVSGKMTVAYEGQEPVTLTPGMYAYGPAKLPHTAVCEKGETCVLFIAFEGPVDAVPAQAGK